MNKVEKIRPDQCRHFDSCSAPLCPLDVKHLKVGIWYPDEDICRLKTSPNWKKIQKKIAKKTKDKNTYYTYEMLNRNCRVGRGMVGLNPDKPEKSQLEDWLKKHPSKKAISEKQKKLLINAREKRSITKVKMKIVACL